MAQYHVVCHTCPFELLVNTEAVADTETSHHDGTNGHDAEYAEVA